MNFLFYLAAIISVFATYKVVTLENAIHALLYTIVSFFGASIIFFLVGAPFMGVLELIVYAGAIMVLFIFVVMLLNIGPGDHELKNQKFKLPVVPLLLSVILFLECLVLLMNGRLFNVTNPIQEFGPKEVGISLFTTYQLSIEIASMILLAGLLVAYYIGKKIENEKKN